MFASTKTTRFRVPMADHEVWIPRSYMERSVDFLLDHAAGALFLDPGMGKTSIVLEAFCILLKEKLVKTMLVIAPKRVCELVWEQEAAKWTQFRHLKFTFLHGPNKAKLLKAKSDIFLINPEGVAWLTDHFWGKKMPFDIVTIDELTKFKNGQAKRHTALRPKKARPHPPLKYVKWIWGLTGTPIPNGYLDLFGQMKMLDGGRCLGQWFSHYRNKYFEKDYTGFNYELVRGGERAIEAAIAPYVLRLASKDYLDLPPLVPDIREVDMPKKARKLYDTMKKEMIVEMGGTEVEAGNAAAVYSKLKQMGNGAVYAGDGVFEPRKVIHLHDAKLEAVEELVDELAGTPLMVAYEFNHDLDRLRKTFGADTPYIGSGVSTKKVRRIERDWNKNKIPVLLVHPASAGHGLNFQLGNACHIAWFSVTWDYELYDQMIKRIFRQGNRALRVFNHIFIVRNTIDIKSLDAIKDKGLTQGSFFDALNEEICQGGKSTVPKTGAEEEEDNMAPRKLKRQKRNKSEDEAPEDEPSVDEQEEEQEEPRRSSRRTSKRGKRKPAPEPDDDGDDRDRDDDADDDDAPTSGRDKFSRAVKKQLDEGDDDGDDRDDDRDRDDDDEPRTRRVSKRGAGSKRKLQGRQEDDDDRDDDRDRDDDEPTDRRSKRQQTRTRRTPEPEDAAEADDDDARAEYIAEMVVEKLLVSLKELLS